MELGRGNFEIFPIVIVNFVNFFILGPRNFIFYIETLQSNFFASLLDVVVRLKSYWVEYGVINVN